jgi:hypothetical protein
MTLPEIVIEEKPPRWPVVLLYVAYPLALAPVALLAFINLFFAGVSGGPHLFFAVALPLVWICGLVLSIVWSERRIAVGWGLLALLAVLSFADALLLLPFFAP